jgi:hypothetical protein
MHLRIAAPPVRQDCFPIIPGEWDLRAVIASLAVTFYGFRGNRYPTAIVVRLGGPELWKVSDDWGFHSGRRCTGLAGVHFWEPSHHLGNYVPGVVGAVEEVWENGDDAGMRATQREQYLQAAYLKNYSGREPLSLGHDIPGCGNCSTWKNKDQFLHEG